MLESKDPTLYHVKWPKAQSRQFPNKIMYTGIVAQPNPLHKFDRNIDLIYVAKEKQQDRTSFLICCYFSVVILIHSSPYLEMQGVAVMSSWNAHSSPLSVVVFSDLIRSILISSSSPSGPIYGCGGGGCVGVGAAGGMA